ncbi:EamA/RhaT family transporter [Halalkalibacillus sediminis]|uniref:EamA/RhaT family transporter n=1 Tax=Halalkalibacillus sediminis TaxID=2018042 RepID=A0A2I0QRF0_9BACI|nr:DMT family transporter [Halalkalibacillus sediminis]PKR76917.1 EamA/RhaT family transporter [Halalkalibacillus sediminis]
MLKSYLFLIITVMIFSGNLLVGKAINELPPVTITFFRCLIAFLVVLPFGFGQFRRHTEIWTTNWKALLGYALTGITAFNILVYLALNYTTSTNAGIVESATPVFAIILSFIFLKERLTLIQLVGVAISFVGAVWVIAEGSLQLLFSLNINVGDLFMLAAIFVWSIYSMIVRQHNHKFPVYGGVVVILGMGIMILIPLVITEWAILGFPQGLDQWNLWLGLIYLGVFPSFIALILWNKGVSDIGPSLASVFLNLLPFFTTIGAVLFLNEKVVAAQIVGGILVVTGVILVNTNFRKLRNLRRRKKIES